MNLVFISNIKISETALSGFTFGNAISTNENSFNVRNLHLDTSGNTIFVIDVHCTFKGCEKLQQQGGVIIYRNLLCEFGRITGALRNLKVIFYSPISKEHLVRLNPENYILEVLPFIELFPKDENGNDIVDWTFKCDLERMKGINFPQFNNAAENILSGWSLANKEKIKADKFEEAKIDLHDNKCLVIDDEWEQWQAAYGEIFTNGSVKYFLKDDKDIKSEFRKLHKGTFNHLPDGSLSQYDFIISDFYLHEPHQAHTWKTGITIKEISGYKLFEKIRDIEKALPVIFHTTSSKFRVFKELEEIGSEGQIPKNNSISAKADEKEDSAQIFIETLKAITVLYGACWVNKFYRYLISVNNKTLHGWWRPSIEDRKKDLQECINQIITALLLFKRFRNTSIHSKEEIYLKSQVNPQSLFYSGIINELGRFTEEVYKPSNPEFEFVKKIRNFTSHSAEYHNISQGIAEILFAQIWKTLDQNKSRDNFGIKLEYPVIEGTNNVRLKKLNLTTEFVTKLNKLGVNPANLKATKYATPTMQHFYSHPLYILMSYYNFQFRFIEKDILEKMKNEIEVCKDDFLINKWNHYHSDEKKFIFSEYKFFIKDSTANTPVFDWNNSGCKLKLH